MSETHIHIHLNGESVAGTPSKGAAKPRRAAKASSSKKAPRKPSAYSKRYGAAFKKVQKKYKKKDGTWAKDGFKKAQKAAHKLAKK